MADHPNFLFIMADQLSAGALGTYGHPVVRTPCLDALAQRGVVFQNCYCNNPLCVPSRASMMTGRLGSRIRAYDNGSDFPASTPTFLHHLRRAGYRTILSGKMHFVGPDQLHGFEERLTTDIYISGFDWTTDWRRLAHGNPGTSVKQLAISGPCDWSMQLDYDEEVHYRALEALRHLARVRDRRPFFLCASYTHPHDPFIITPEFWSLYEGVDIDPPAAPSRPLAEMAPYERWLQIHHEVDRYPPTEEQVLRARRAHYGMVSYFDRKVGELVAELDRLGLGENTLILVTSDHGEMLGEHGMWFKRTWHERSSHVPLIGYWPGVPGGRRVAEVVSLVDLFPTLLALADVAPAEHELDGDSFAAAFTGELEPWKDTAFIEYLGEGILRPMRAVRRGRHKYVYVDQHAPRLFDLEVDPLEQRNLAGRSDKRDLVRELHDLVLHDWDPAAQAEDIARSQRDRLLIFEALGQGAPSPWDHQPHFDASKQYVRSGHVSPGALGLQRPS